jgi:predicted SAM-dependent methyltransferase
VALKRILKKGLKQMGYGLVRHDLRVDDRELYRQVYGENSIRRKAFYNLSCGGHFGFGGNFSHSCWTNIDVDREYPEPPQFKPELGIAHDPMDMGELPLDSESAELFHSRFAFEHIPDEAARVLMKEVHRCLKGNGIFRIIVPNTRLDYEAYLRDDRHYFSWIESHSRPALIELMKYTKPMNQLSLAQVFLIHFAGTASPFHSDGADNPIEDEEFIQIIEANPLEKALDICTARCSLEKQRLYRQNHINWWTHEKMARFMNEAGFSKVMILTPDQSMAPVMRNTANFFPLWNEVALYMEGIK